MSCYEWEQGSITIPGNQWAAFRKGLLAAWNARQEQLLIDAKTAHQQCKDAGKGKRGPARLEAQKLALHRFCGDQKFGGDQGYYGHTEKYENFEALLFASVDQVRRSKLQSPKKKDLELKPVSKGCTIEIDGGSIGFSNVRKSVFWEVEENNHACEHTRGHWFAHKFFAALNQISWTRGSGGEIIGNDEYNRDSCDSGGGANYVVAEYGPKT